MTGRFATLDWIFAAVLIVGGGAGDAVARGDARGAGLASPSLTRHSREGGNPFWLDAVSLTSSSDY